MATVRVATGSDPTPGQPATRRSAESNATEPRRYDGLTLAEWGERIKSLDLSDPASRAAVPGLISIARDRDAPWVRRRQAMETLGRLGTLAPEGVPVAIALLDEPSDAEAAPRHWALKAIALYGPVAKPAAPRVLALMQEEGRPLLDRAMALEAAGRIGGAHPDTLPAVLKILQAPLPPIGDESANLRRREAAELRELAVEAISLFGPHAAPAAPALIRLTREPSDILRAKAAQALGTLGGRGEIAIPSLIELLLFDTSPLVRDVAGEALAKIGAEAAPALTQLLDDADPGTRGRAAAALGGIGRAARAATEPLAARLDDESSDVRLRAAEALWSITRDPKVAAPATARLIACDDRTVRLRAVRLLSGMGRRADAAAPVLRSLLDDERAQVRDAARKALAKIGHPVEKAP